MTSPESANKLNTEGSATPFQIFQEKIGPAATALFLAALAVEAVVVVAEKSIGSIPYESLIFKATFAASLLRMLTVRYQKKELPLIAVMLLLGVLSWRLGGHNEYLRAVALIAACRGLDVKKILRFVLWGQLAACIALVLLSVFGIFGKVSITADFGHGMEVRYCLGLGHPNALHCMACMLLLLALYLYGETMPRLALAGLFAGNVLLYLLTGSDSGLLTGSAAILLTAVSRAKAAQKGLNAAMIAGEALIAGGICFSLITAVFGGDVSIIRRLDGILTGRVASLWDTTYLEGTFWTWGLFGRRGNEAMFDLGWVRLFYWYGVIPAAAVIVLVFLILRQVRRDRDAAAFIFILCCCVYTVFEAHLVSVYLMRNYLLLVAAMQLPRICGEERELIQ